MIASSTVYGPDPNWNAKRAAGKTHLRRDRRAGTRRCSRSSTSTTRAASRTGAAGAGFDALTNGASQGKMFGFFAPSGAAKDIMDAAGGHVKLVALAFPAPQGLKTYLTAERQPRARRQREDEEPQARRGLHQVLRVARRRPRSSLTRRAPSRSARPSSSSDLLPQYQPVAGLFQSQQYRAVRRGHVAQRPGLRRPRHRRDRPADRPEVDRRRAQVDGRGLGQLTQPIAGGASRLPTRRSRTRTRRRRRHDHDPRSHRHDRTCRRGEQDAGAGQPVTVTASATGTGGGPSQPSSSCSG